MYILYRLMQTTVNACLLTDLPREVDLHDWLLFQ